MQITTRFDIGQRVYPIRQQQKPVTTPACEVCNGENFSQITVDVPKYGELLINCPNKRGDSNNHRPIVVDVNTDWVVLDVEEVIKLTMRYEDATYKAGPNWKPFHPNNTTYALSPDKVNSHQVWQEDDLFASSEQAQAACDRRNEEAELEISS